MGKCEDMLRLCLGMLSSRICSIGFFKYRAELQRYPVVISQHGKISNLVFKTQMALPPRTLFNHKKGSINTVIQDLNQILYLQIIKTESVLGSY